MAKRRKRDAKEMRRGRRGWSQKVWIVDYWLKRMKDPFEEPYSIRQVFYKELPEITKIVPEEVKTKTKDWAMSFYNRMAEYLSDLVLEGKASYRTINIFNDSGASSYILQNISWVSEADYYDLTVEYPIEVWVENNASYNSLESLFNKGKSKTAKFNINLLSTRGPAKTQQIEKMKRERKEDVKVILNLTDFDPSGYNMPRDLQNRCHQIGLDLDVKHIGILPTQIPEERRTTSLIRYKKRDPRCKRLLEAFPDDPLVQEGFGYEIQALMPPEIRELTAKHILATVQDYGFEKRTAS